MQLTVDKLPKAEEQHLVVDGVRWVVSGVKVTESSRRA